MKRIKRTVWKDRRAGMLIAFPLVLAMLIPLNFMVAGTGQAQRNPSPPQSQVMYVDLQLDDWQKGSAASAYQPNPDPKNSKGIILERSEVINIVTSPESQGGQLMETIDADNDRMPPPVNNDKVALEDWSPTNDEAAQLDQIRSEVAQNKKELSQRATKVRESNIRMEVDSAMKDFKLNSDGGVEGAIRLLNVDGLAPAKIQPVLDKYGISFERRHTKPTSGRGFLNSAATSRGTFRDVSTEGYYDVMVLSGRAVHFMATLETEALMNRNYDPATTRIRKITFGIINNGQGELDLGVIDLQVEQIR
ncbi:hypothetical protein IT570_09585 [Candidatus Sumerlaeota bacterium]|nr:hypothetical protein [Candidatus Sumerlaeota bacterium]